MALREIKKLMKNGDFAKADAELKAIVECEPGNVQAKLLYGTCRLLLGDEDTFRKIHDEVEPRISFEKDVEVISAWRKYSRLLKCLLAGALVLGATATVTCYLVKDFQRTMETHHNFATTPEFERSCYSLYAGPPEYRLKKDPAEAKRFGVEAIPPEYRLKKDPAEEDYATIQ